MSPQGNTPPSSQTSLTALAGVPAEKGLDRRIDDHAWIEVIQRMDAIYAELVEQQVELETKNAELENTRNFIQSVISSISDILIVCDVNGNIQQVNAALEQATGLTSQSLVGKPLSGLIGEDYQSLIAEFPEHIRSGSITDCEIDLLNQAGDALPMAINCSARYDHKNRLSGFVITGRPLGELRRAYSALHRAHEDLKNAQQQLIQSEKLASLGRLVAGVAHELNNPISFLYANMHALKAYESKFQTYLDAIHRDISTEERERLRAELKIDRMMDDIDSLMAGSLEGAERVSEIIKNLRRFSTPQQEEKSCFDLVTVIERATSWVLKASNLKPQIVTDYPESLTLINNEGHVHQILINLIQNAIDAMADTAQPRLEIRLKQTGAQGRQHRVEIHIRDNGPGIGEDDILRIFDPFYTTKAVGSGTGLGLYISYGLATEQCGGDLRAIRHKNQGAEFIFSLPLDQPQQHDANNIFEPESPQ